MCAIDRDKSFPSLFELTVAQILKAPEKLHDGNANQEVANILMARILQSRDAQLSHFQRLKNVTVCDMTSLPIEDSFQQTEFFQKIIDNNAKVLEILKSPQALNFSNLQLKQVNFDRLRILHIPSLYKCSQETLNALCDALPEQMDELVISDCNALRPIFKKPIQVKRLVIKNSNITNVELQGLSKCLGKTLLSLSLANCANITSFEGCCFPELREIDISDTNVTNEGLRQLFGVASHLEILNISRCNTITSFDQIKFPELHTLYAARTGLTDISLQELERTAPALVELDISGCTSITTFNKTKFLNLHVLKAARTMLTNDGLKCLATAAPHLVNLDITFCLLITMLAGIDFPNLHILKARATRITNDSLKQLGSGAPYLEDLDISLCKEISSFQGSQFPHLLALNVVDTPLTRDGFVELFRAAPHLKPEIVDQLRNRMDAS